MRRAAGCGLRAAGCGVLVLVACGKKGEPAHRLEGSLSVVMDVRYDVAQVESSTEEVAVRFVRLRNEGEDVVLKVTANLLGTAVTPSVPIDLAELTPAGAQRGVVSRNVFDDPKRSFPRLERGRLILRAGLSSGTVVPGEFSVTFENGTDVASGRTVFGTFQGDVP